MSLRLKDFISKESKKLHIYCDGSCKGNPGPSGSGLSLYIDDHPSPILLYGGFFQEGTNNTAEIAALYVALQIAGKYGIADTIIFSDSKYSIDSITKWAYNWAKNGWEDRPNIETIKKAHLLYISIKDIVEVRYVKGHSGNEGNELADRMANMAVENKKNGYCIHPY